MKSMDTRAESLVTAQGVLLEGCSLVLCRVLGVFFRAWVLSVC